MIAGGFRGRGRTCPRPPLGVTSLAVALAAAASIWPAPGSTAAAPQAPCDRVCLEQVADRYLQALVARAPERLRLAAHVRYTENGQLLDLHDGLWGTATAPGTYRNVFADPFNGQVIVFTVLHENAYLDLVGTRLRTQQGEVTEIETIVSRPSGQFGSGGAETLERNGKPDVLWSTAVPANQRMSRADLLKVANEYFTGMENNDGHGVYPFADDCFRLENGTQTTGNPALKMGNSASSAGINYAALGCKAQFELGLLHVVSRIRDRRFLIVDRERGVVVAFGFFDHNAQLRSYALSNGKSVPNGLSAPITWELVEAFRIEHGLIRRIEAVLTQAPYGMPPNWPESDLGYDPRHGP
jgi:hypothetical protein